MTMNPMKMTKQLNIVVLNTQTGTPMTMKITSVNILQLPQQLPQLPLLRSTRLMGGQKLLPVSTLDLYRTAEFSPYRSRLNNNHTNNPHNNRDSKKEYDSMSAEDSSKHMPRPSL